MVGSYSSFKLNLTLFLVGYFLRTESVGGAYMPPLDIFLPESARSVEIGSNLWWDYRNTLGT